MLKPINQAICSGALAAGQNLMRSFALWLCDTRIDATHITEANCLKRLPSHIEGNWLWDFLQKKTKKTPLLEHACTVAELSTPHKNALRTWVMAVSNVPQHLLHPPQANLPTPPPLPKAEWEHFKILMLAFYSKGLHEIGLPYLDNGTPTNNKIMWLTYHRFRDAFLNANRIGNNPDNGNICVICGGAMEQIDVDHWICEAAYPLLSVCAYNLIPICSVCNKRPNKGTKNVHTDGSFNDWYHPYLRQVKGGLQLNYLLQPKPSVKVSSVFIVDQPKTVNLDSLLNLSDRWTKQFKSEYLNKQDEIRRLKARREQRNGPPLTQADLENKIDEDKEIMSPQSADFEVRQLVCAAILERARLDAWQQELELED